MESSMTSQERAELLFKKPEDLAGDQVVKSEYEQRAHAEREKMAGLRALRLARDAELAANPRRRTRKRKRTLIEAPHPGAM
jgi:hypothetical protein